MQVKQLSEISSQPAAVAVLRAKVIKKDLSSLLLVGPEEATYELYAAFMKAFMCESPKKGDWCGECSFCMHYPYQPGPASIPTVAMQENDASSSAYDLTLRLEPEEIAHDEAYVEAKKLLIRLLKSSPKEIAEKSREYVTKHSYVILLDRLIALYLALLNAQLGVFTEYDEILSKLSVSTSSVNIKEALRLLWQEKTREIDLPDEDKAEILLLVLLFPVFRPTDTYDLVADEMPIYVIEETPSSDLSGLEKVFLAD